MSESERKGPAPETRAEKSTKSPQSREVSSGSENKEKRQVPESLREAFNAAADVALSRIMKKIASKEGMPTDAASYRTEIIAVLKGMDAKLPEWHALKGTTDLIVENFLSPEEKGAELVRTMLEKGYAIRKGNEKPSVGPKEYDAGMSAVRSTLGFSIDLAKKKPEKIGEFMTEIKRVPEAKELLSRFPDLETVLVRILPEIAKNVDKETFLRAFDEFAKETKPVALSLVSGKELGEKERGDAALKVAHELARLVSSALTKETVKSWVDGISDLSVVKNNPIASKLVELVKRPELSDEERLALVKKANEGIVVFTKNPPNEAELEKYANSASELVSSLSKKLPKELVTDAMTSIFLPDGGGKKMNVEIKSAKELAKLLYENKEKLVTAIALYATGKIKNMKDVVRFIVEERVLEENVNMAKGELVGRLKKIVDIDLAAFSEKLKAKLSSDMAGSGQKNVEKSAEPTGLRDALSNKVLSEMAATFFGPNRPAKVTKELLAEKVSASALSAIDGLPGNSVKIGNADVPKTALKAAVWSNEFKTFAADAFAKVAGEAGNGGATMEKMASIVAEIMKDPLGNRHTGERTKTFAIDAFYALPASEIALTVANNLEVSGIGGKLKKPDGSAAFDKHDIEDVVNILRDGEILSKETLVKTLSKENLTPPVDALKIVKSVVDSLSREQVSLLVAKLTAKRADGSASLLEKGLSVDRSWMGGKLTKENVSKIIDLIFEASSKTDWESRKAIFDSLKTNAAIAEYGVTFLKTFGKERVTRFAEDHFDAVSDLLSGRLDPRKNPEKLIPLAVDVAYSADPATESRMFAETKSAFPALKWLLESRVFWSDVETHFGKIKNAVPKERMRAFLENHSEELSGLSKRFDAAKAAKLGSKLLLEIDSDKLGSLVDVSKLSGTEKLAGEKLPQIRNALDSFRKETVTTPDGKTVSRLDALIDASAAAAEGKLSKKEAEFLSGEAFDLVSRLLPTLGEWKIPDGNDSPSETVKKFKSEFVSNNFGFVIGQAIPYLFGRPTETIVSSYFADGGNKEAFVKTLSATLTKKA